MSITIIDKINPPAPKWTYQPKELDKLYLDNLRFGIEEANRIYYEREFVRFIEGYGGLTGRYYHYLQVIPIYKQSLKNFGRPDWRQCDDDFFWEWDDCEKKLIDMVWTAPRGLGKTTIISSEGIYRYNTEPISIITYSTNDDTNIEGIIEKVTEYVSNMDTFIRPEWDFKKSKGVLSDTSTSLATHEVKNKKTKKSSIDYSAITSGRKCTLLFSTVQKSTGAEGSRPSIMFIDEFYLQVNGVKKVHSAQGNLGSSSGKTGIVLCCGAANEIERKPLMKIKNELYKEKDELGIKFYYTFSWMSDFRFMINGYYLEDEAKEYYYGEANRLKQLENKTRYRNFIKYNLLDEASLWELKSSSWFDLDIVERLNEQKRRIRNQQELRFKPYNLEWIYDEKGNRTWEVKATPSSEGIYWILVHPTKSSIEYKYQFLHTTDPIEGNSTSESETLSHHAMTTLDRTKNMFVAYMEIRVQNSEILFDATLKLHLYYGGLNGIETNAMGDIMNLYKKAGYYQKLAWCPKKIHLLGKRELGLKGLRITAHNKPMIITLFIFSWLVNNIENIWSEYLIDKLFVWAEDENSDLGDAMMLAGIWDLELIDALIEQAQHDTTERTAKKETVFGRDGQGRMRYYEKRIN